MDVSGISDFGSEMPEVFTRSREPVVPCEFVGGAGDELLHLTLEDIGDGSLEKFSRLSPSGREYLRMLMSLHQKNDSRITQDSIDALYAEDYERVPPDPATFLESNDYCGHIGASLWPPWHSHFRRVCDPQNSIYEVNLTGSIGSGKTLFAMLVIAYKTTRLLCLRNPAAFYGLVPGTRITLGVYAVTKTLAKKTGFHDLRDVIIDQSPFFKYVYVRKKPGAEALFWETKQVEVLFGSNILHSVGMNLFSVTADELNYYAQGEGDRSAVRAFDLVSDVSRRLESRFMDYWGGIPGVAVFLSQTRTVNDFLEERVHKNAGKPGIYVVRGPIWTFCPSKYGSLVERAKMRPGVLNDGSVNTVCGDVQAFRVYTGEAIQDARILDKVTQAIDGSYVVERFSGEIPTSGVIHVPVNHYKAFEDDIYGALRAIADVPTGGYTPFFSRRDAVAEVFDESLKNPFGSEIIPCYEGQAMEIRQLFDYEAVTQVHMGRRVPIRHPKAPRYIHFDLSKNRDRTGVVMVHPSEYYFDTEQSTESGIAGTAVNKSIEVDFYVAFSSGPDGQAIDYRKMRVFVDWLRGLGYWIKLCSSDQYMHHDHLMRLREIGFETEIVSVDRNIHPYRDLWSVIVAHRIAAPFPTWYTPLKCGSRSDALWHTLLFQELIGLEHDVASDKVDHRDKNPDGSRGSKDIADGLTATVHKCLTDTTNQDINPNKEDEQSRVVKRYDRYLQVAPF